MAHCQKYLIKAKNIDPHAPPNQYIQIPPENYKEKLPANVKILPQSLKNDLEGFFRSPSECIAVLQFHYIL